MPQGVSKTSLTAHYKKLLDAREHSPSALEGLESTTEAEPDLSNSAIGDRVSATRAALYEIIKTHLGDQSVLYQIADKIVETGGEALRVLRGEDDEELAQRPDVIDGLETIVRTDGSRPSFMVRNAEPDLTTSPAGTWAGSIAVSNDLLRDALDCIGRINVPGSAQGFQGTGFLIHENLIVTNRHVLQVTAKLQSDGSWKLKSNASIDFGHEFNARNSVNRRKLKRLVYTGPDPIVDPIDHKKLDLALIELEPANSSNKPKMVLGLNGTTDWADPSTRVYIVGYPGSPQPGLAPPSLLEQLFKSTFGFKRLAPGLLMTPQSGHTWTLAHDSTTLGGNSGSPLLMIGDEQIAAGLHYGGRWSDPRENWGHVLGKVLDQADTSGKTLREHLDDFDVQPIM